MTMRSRTARVEDVHAMVSMLLDMADESPAFRRRRFDVAKVETAIRGAIGVGGAFITTDAGCATGLLVGMADESWWCDEIVASDLAFYVRPEARGSWAIVRLVRLYESWAARIGADRATLGTSSGILPMRTAALLKRLGFERNAEGFAKSLNPTA